MTKDLIKMEEMGDTLFKNKLHLFHSQSSAAVFIREAFKNYLADFVR